MIYNLQTQIERTVRDPDRRQFIEQFQQFRWGGTGGGSCATGCARAFWILWWFTGMPTEHNEAGELFKSIDPAGKEDRTYFDDAGRVTKTIENYTDGDPTTGAADEDRTVEFTYTPDGTRATITAKQQNSDEDQ